MMNKDYKSFFNKTNSTGKFLIKRNSVISKEITTSDDLFKYTGNQLLADLGEFKIYNNSPPEVLTEDTFNALFKWKESETGFSPYQYWSIWLAHVYHRSFIVCKMGLGKTAIAMGAIQLEILKRKNSAILNNRTSKPYLFLVPQRTAVEGIVNEFKTRSNLKTIKLSSALYKEWDTTVVGNDVVVCTYATFLRLVSSTVTVRTAGINITSATTEKLITQEYLIKLLRERLAGVIFDEGQSMKSGDGSISQAARETFDVDSFSGLVMIMTGTPVGKIGDDLFHIMRILDGGKSFGTSLNYYRSTFCHEANVGPVTTFPLIKNLIPEILLKLKKDRTIIVDIHHTDQDFPDFDFKYYNAPLSVEQSIELNQLRNTASTPSVRYGKTIMYLAGARNTTTAEKLKHSATHVPIKNPPKIPILVKAIEEITSDTENNHYVGLVFHHHIISGKLIEEELKKRKINHIVLRKKSLKEVQEKMQEAKDSKTPLIVIAQNISAGSSLNLQLASFIIYYNLPIGVTNLDQSSARIRRRTSKDSEKQQRLLVFIINIEHEKNALTTLLASWEKTSSLYGNIEQVTKAKKALAKFLKNERSNVSSNNITEISVESLMPVTETVQAPSSNKLLAIKPAPFKLKI